MRLDPHEGLLPEQAFKRLGRHMTYEGGKGSSSAAPPTVVDNTGAALAQSAASKEIATQQTWANRPTQKTPWGTTDWSAIARVDPSTGQPITKWSQEMKLSPELQKALDSQMALQAGRSDLAGSFMDRLRQTYADPMDYSKFAERRGEDMARTEFDTSRLAPTTQTTNEPAFAGERQRLEQAAYERMAPEHQRAQQQLEQQLANQGITPGSEAYHMAQQQLSDNQARERWNAMAAGGAEQQRMQQMLLQQQGQAFGQAGTAQQQQNAALQAQQAGDITGANFQNQLRLQQISEEAQRRGMTLNEMIGVMEGQQVATPQMPGFIGASAGQAPNLVGAANAQYQQGLDAYNASQMQQQGQNAGISGLFGLGGSILGGMYGGPAGASIGGSLGSGIGRLFG
jgi:hypothetical protein